MFIKLTISIFFISHIYYLFSLNTSPYPYANLFKIWTVYRENDKQTQKCSHPPKRWYKIDLFLIYHEMIVLIGTSSDVIAGEFPQAYGIDRIDLSETRFLFRHGNLYHFLGGKFELGVFSLVLTINMQTRNYFNYTVC